MGDAAEQALHVKSGSFEVDASQASVNGTLTTIDHLWTHTLGWISENPIQFYAILLLVAWWLYLRRRERVEIARLKADYAETRRLARENPLEPPLPLPEPSHGQTKGESNARL